MLEDRKLSELNNKQAENILWHAMGYLEARYAKNLQLTHDCLKSAIARIKIAESKLTTFTATIQFQTTSAGLAQIAFSMMRETFCNDPELQEIRSSLIDERFNQIEMIKC